MREASPMAVVYLCTKEVVVVRWWVTGADADPYFHDRLSLPSIICEIKIPTAFRAIIFYLHSFPSSPLFNSLITVVGCTFVLSQGGESRCRFAFKPTFHSQIQPIGRAK